MGIIPLFIQSITMIYSLTLIIYIFMFWFTGGLESKFGKFLGVITEPYLNIFRRIIPPRGRLDVTPIIALIVLRFTSDGLIILLRMVGL